MKIRCLTGVVGRIGLVGVLAAVAPALAGTVTPLPTGPNDFFGLGTQSGGLLDPLTPYDELCKYCHAEYDPAIQEEPGRWRGSMHAHSAKDPVFLAAVAIANQDAPGAGETCFRCHAPSGWIEGRVAGAPDGSNLMESDYREGVSCHLCHRMVDPSPNVGDPPDTAMADAEILMNLGSLVPFSAGNGQYVVDPFDYRRGPFDLGPGFFYHAWRQSPFHQRGEMCATCHDVSNPLLDRGPGPYNGVYTVNAVDTAHPTGNTQDMFPEQRTYSEWANSAFAAAGIDMGGRFGGNLAVVSQCQDCHQPDLTGGACIPGLGPTIRNDFPYHSFQGANRWMIDVILEVYTGTPLLDEPTIDALNVAKGDIEYMLLNSTDMQLSQVGADLGTRIINQCGHKLMTGMPEGRRMWINVKFKNAKGAVIAERGAYDPKNAVLNESDTKVYECKFGVDAAMSALTGLPVGPSFHLVLNNAYFKDNRIPPRGFTNAAFTTVGASPVAYSYPDGQYWDDTGFFIPAGAATAEVTFYYQIASREYMEFLRDENLDSPPNDGTRAYDAWVATDKSPPFAMDNLTLSLNPYLPADFNGDGMVNGADLSVLLSAFGDSGVRPSDGDANGDGVVNSADLSVLLSNFGLIL